MLTRVLLKFYFRFAAILFVFGFGLTYLLMGEAVSKGMLVGSLITMADGAVLIWVVGVLLDPNQSGGQKAVFGTVLLFKLVVIGALLWSALSVWGYDGLGLIIGVGLGMFSLVLGVNQGSSSPEGQRAIAEAEAKIEQQMRDNQEDSE